MMCASSSRVLFLMKCHPEARCSPDQARKLVQVIRSIAPLITFQLVIMNEYDRSESQFSFRLYPPECIVMHMVGNVNPHHHSIWECNIPRQRYLVISGTIINFPGIYYLKKMIFIN